MKISLTVSFMVCCTMIIATEGVYLTLKRYNTNIKANSVINVNRIGEELTSYSYYYYGRYTRGGPLVCHTEDPTCCRAQDNPDEYVETGDWYYPNGDAVEEYTTSYSSFYVTRDFKELALHSSSNNGYPTGVYCCDIDAVNGTNITLEESEFMENVSNSSSAICVGIYTSSQLSLCNDLYVRNGYVEYDSPYIPGRVAEFNCYPGYALVGPSTRVCTSYGWSGYTPSCEVDCGPPPPLQNGMVTVPGYTGGIYRSGSRAVYSCNEGFILLGENTRVCNRRVAFGWSLDYYYSSRNRMEPLCVDTTLVQIVFSPSEYCLTWGSSRSRTLTNALEAAIIDVVNEGLMEQYNNVTQLTSTHVRDTYFRCQPSSNRTTFRATLLGTDKMSAKVFENLLQTWVNGNPSLLLEWYAVDIDSNCPVSVASPLERECGDNLNPVVERCVEICKASYERNSFNFFQG